MPVVHTSSETSVICGRRETGTDQLGDDGDETDGSGGATASFSDDEDGDEEELVIDDALLAQDAPFELRCWSGAVTNATAGKLHELCAEAFMAFQGRSFWVPADRSPRMDDGGWAVLERFAADVYVRDSFLVAVGVFLPHAAVSHVVGPLISRHSTRRGLLVLI